MAYIYKITNTINGKMYIGKTELSITQRWKAHLKDSKTRRCEQRPLYSAINKYGAENFIIEEVENCLSEQSNEREKYWITFYKTYQEGYNATLGGDSRSYINYSQVIDLYASGKTCKEIGKELNIDVGTVSKILKSNNIEVKRNNPTPKKKVQMLSLSGEKIKEFNSITEATNYLNKTDGTNIGRACKGTRDTAYGFKWEYN